MELLLHLLLFLSNPCDLFLFLLGQIIVLALHLHRWTTQASHAGLELTDTHLLLDWELDLLRRLLPGRHRLGHGLRTTWLLQNEFIVSLIEVAKRVHWCRRF